MPARRSMLFVEGGWQVSSKASTYLTDTISFWIGGGASLYSSAASALCSECPSLIPDPMCPYASPLSRYSVMIAGSPLF